MSASSSDTGRPSRNYMNMRGRSSSPNRSHRISNNNTNTTITTATTGKDQANLTTTTTTTTTTHTTNVIPVQRNSDNEEPIRLSKFSGGYAPDPQTPHKIEGLDWPAPPYPAAVPELRARSRSSSNRRAPSTVNSVCGGIEEQQEDANESGDSSNDDDNDEEVKRVLIDGVETQLTVSGGSRSASSSALARVKASRPNSKLR